MAPLKFPFAPLLLPLLFWLPVLTGVGAQNTDVSARFDSNHVETGELFGLQITVPRAAGKPDPVDFQPWVSDSLYVHTQTGWKPEGDLYVNRFSLITFDADTLLLPPLQVVWNNGQSAATPELPLVVLATPSPYELSDIQDIKDIYREPARWADYLPYLIGAVLLLLVVSLLIWALRRHKNRPALVQQRIIRQPPHVLALRRLEGLCLPPTDASPASVKEFYAALTHIFREYMEHRYRFPALESVSSEIMRALQKTEFPDTLLPATAGLLEQADRVKFAKALPPETCHGEALAFVKKAVAQTAQGLESSEPALIQGQV